MRSKALHTILLTLFAVLITLAAPGAHANLPENRVGLSEALIQGLAGVEQLANQEARRVYSDVSYDFTSDVPLASKGTSKLRNKPPAPLKEAEGRPHSIIERPGKDGQYTTHNGDGTWKQYRGSGQDHGGIPRPNVKEAGKNVRSDGQVFIDKGRVRPAHPDEIPGD